jgi:hypothetical protein
MRRICLTLFTIAALAAAAPARAVAQSGGVGVAPMAGWRASIDSDSDALSAAAFGVRVDAPLGGRLRWTLEGAWWAFSGAELADPPDGGPGVEAGVEWTLFRSRALHGYSGLSVGALAVDDVEAVASTRVGIEPSLGGPVALRLEAGVHTATDERLWTADLSAGLRIRVR